MEKKIQKFTQEIRIYYKKSKRDFPWRRTRDPYKILVSELMLQQTQVDRVLPKYQEFLKKFPTTYDLSQAKLADVLAVWSGLGYNRRAKYLQKCVQEIVKTYGGKIPDEQKALESLPGIGTYTSAAICAFAFNKPCVVMDTNIRRVYIHFFFSDKEKVHDKEIEPLIVETLNKKNPREWYWALMDYGTYLAKIAKNPNRKSAHYIKQSPFENSVRKVRGEIMRLLISQKKLSYQELWKSTGVERKKFDLAVASLQKDGLINHNDQTVYMA